MNFEIDYIKDLAKILEENNLSELTIEDNKGGGNKSITLKKTLCMNSNMVTSLQVPGQSLQNNINNNEENIKESNDTPKGTPITSPMVGTFYEAPSPKLSPFVKEGDTISKGQVICIIEAMKLMNEIESDISGKVTKICVKNGDAVEFGQVLMYIE